MADIASTYIAMARKLREGESISRTRRVPVDGFGGNPPSKALSTLRNSMNQVAARARDATGRGYRVESGHYMTYDGQAVMLNVVLTCMEDEGEDDI